MCRAPAAVFAAAAAAAASCLACEDSAPALLVHLHSDLQIPRETNTLFVRVTKADHTTSEQTYTLGQPPRDVWPQILPIIAGDQKSTAITLEAELRNSQPGAPSVAVGYAKRDAMLPASGESAIDFEIPRDCVDGDGDGYGVGFGCINPDCDDTRNDVPVPNFCPGPPAADGGVSDDGGAGDAGAEVCAPPGGGPPATCTADQACFEGHCLARCAGVLDCEDISYGCFTTLGVCICRVPCQNSGDCGPFVCRDGCCHLQ